MAAPTKFVKKRRNSYELLVRYFKSRPDIGLRAMLLDVALKPRSRFKPRERRKFKKGFVAAALFLVAALAWFGYFSLRQ